jgi:hypothetical protein
MRNTFTTARPAALALLMGPTMPCVTCGTHIDSTDDEGFCSGCRANLDSWYRPPQDDRPVYVFDNGDNNPDPHFSCRRTDDDDDDEPVRVVVPGVADHVRVIGSLDTGTCGWVMELHTLADGRVACEVTYGESLLTVLRWPADLVVLEQHDTEFDINGRDCDGQRARRW